MYIQDIEYGGNITFRDFIQNHIKVDHAKDYEQYKFNNPGISNKLRFSDEGEALIMIMDDVKVQRVYIAPTEVMTKPLGLALDTDYINGEVRAHWKVRLYADNNYSNL